MADETQDLATRSVEVDADIEVRDAVKRELEVRLLPWNFPIDTLQGRELVEPGAFSEVDPSKVFLMAPEHGATLGLGQAGAPKLVRIPAGKGVSIDEKSDPIGPRMVLRASKTQAGDEILALAQDRILTSVSIEFGELPGGTVTEMRDGRRTRIHKRLHLSGVAPTYRPAYGEQAAVLSVRSQEEKEAPEVAETQEAPASGAPFDPSPFLDEVRKGFETVETRTTETFDKMFDRLEKIEERQRSNFVIPGGEPEKPKVSLGKWASAAIRIFAGDRISDTEMRTLADIVTTDNVGVVPPTYSSELIGVIDPARPFMNTTRRLATPESGMSLILPRIKTRPTVGIQANEKDELTSTPTEVDTVTFDAVTKGGAGDLSLQIIRRSSPSFLDLYVRLLAEAYAIDSEHEATEALIATVGDYLGAVDGGSLDPDNLSLGSAWTQSIGSTIKRSPDTIWMSSAAVAAFIDAKANGTNAPLYSQLQANFTAGGGIGGTISGLRAVHVPALDDQAYDVIVGPSNGFAWAEDGTFTLQVDVPGKAGRDVALVGILWFCPLYPSAFTTYNLAS